uniref:Uncharacterized protein n=1 Tax=Rousettus aegyptiacus TaxID=9407 RepID=A0A7J8F0U0_ROUAE|nr:hypothetical protein HJG63_012345 [Rousettus aegyptiacus]
MHLLKLLDDHNYHYSYHHYHYHYHHYHHHNHIYLQLMCPALVLSALKLLTCIIFKITYNIILSALSSKMNINVDAFCNISQCRKCFANHHSIIFIVSDPIQHEQPHSVIVIGQDNYFFHGLHFLNHGWYYDVCNLF